MAQLLKISLVYDDGTVLTAQESDPPTIGTKFMEAIKGQDIKWKMSKNKNSFIDELVKIFTF